MCKNLSGDRCRNFPAFRSTSELPPPDRLQTLMETPTLNYEPKPPPPPARERDDLAYILPMAVFLAFIWLGGKGTATEHGNTWYPWAYAARAVVVAALLIYFRKAYTRNRWNYWWLG